MKIIKIDGFRGLLTVVFIVSCVFAGFVIFPGIVAMHLWNKYLVTLALFPVLNTFQGVLLWGIIAVSYFIITKGKCAVSFKQAPMISDPEMNMIIRNAKIYSQMRKINNEVTKSDKFDKNSSNNVVPINKKELSEIESDISSVDKKEESVSNIK